jgi:carbon storage regulator
MLVLTRRIGETIVIDDDIRVTVLGIQGQQIRLGIDAPKEVEIHRQEIWNKIQKENGNG